MKHSDIRHAALVLAASLLLTQAHATPTYIPVVNGQFSVGQWYFEGDSSSMGGNAALLFAPALRFSNRFSLIPTVSSTYQGTLSAQEFAGGVNLFQDQWENAASIKAVHGLSSKWSLKERASYRIKWLRETEGEQWGSGLYDYRAYSVGAELERRWGRKASVSLSYDYSFLRFPNYVSLESTQSSDLSREFAGENVLDEHINVFTLSGWAPVFWGMGVQAQVYSSPRQYTDQTIVQRTGLLSADKRKDLLNGVALSVDRAIAMGPRFTLVPNISYGATVMDSDQNHYDARVNTFVPNFYDYTQQSVGLKFTLAVKHTKAPMLIDIAGGYSVRDYSDRVTQTQDGLYLTEKLWTVEKSLAVGFRYPLSKNLHLRATSSFGRSTSNTDYEAVYRYNYRNADYQLGFTYDY